MTAAIIGAAFGLGYGLAGLPARIKAFFDELGFLVEGGAP